MTKLLTKFHKGQKGFTLIELLVVIAILGVIAAVAIPNVLRFMDEGDTEAARAEQHNLQVAVSAYMYENESAVPTVKQASVYLMNDLQYDWIILDEEGNEGKVEPDPDGDNPLNEETEE